MVLQYLPLAHVMGRSSLYYFYSRGVGIGIFGGDLTKLMEDLQILKPTNFMAVPRIIMKLYDGIKAKVQQMSWLKRKRANSSHHSMISSYFLKFRRF